jgi:hypothetical protein
VWNGEEAAAAERCEAKEEVSHGGSLFDCLYDNVIYEAHNSIYKNCLYKDIKTIPV